MPKFYEFFAGGGMARLGLGQSWQCTFANDIDPKKASIYRENFGGIHFSESDIHDLSVANLPGRADLAWASFPCQDLSLAGTGRGLNAERSGTFWPFWRLMEGLVKRRRAPRVIVLENVCGALTSNRGRDFAELGAAISRIGYRFGALVIDAVHFVPQSRPRLFVIAVAPSVTIATKLKRTDPNISWHPRNLVEAKFRLPKTAQDSWIWWDLPQPTPRPDIFADLIDEDEPELRWHSQSETRQLLEMMSPANRAKVRQAQLSETRQIGALYRRTRNGVQRAEVRFDDVAGCLRTPVGGSSRQTIIVIEANSIRSRLLSPRETARLMGLPDDYKLPARHNDAYYLTGDGVVVPVVGHLCKFVLEPLVSRGSAKATALG